jgi:hypothetical protein
VFSEAQWHNAGSGSRGLDGFGIKGHQGKIIA